MPDPRTRQLPPTDTGSTLLPDGLVVYYMDEEGHLHIAEDDIRDTRRLTWDSDDFSFIPGMPAIPGATGELEDTQVFAHPTPSADGKRIALFGLLPTDGFGNSWDGHPWEFVEEHFPYLSTEGWPPEDEEDTLPDDIAGLAMAVIDGDPEAIDEDAVVLSVEEEDDDETILDEDQEEEMYWPGGKVYVLHRDGVQVWEPWEFESGSPTHLEWTPDDRQLLVLCQQERELELLWVDVDEPGRGRLLMSGAPIFWGWRPGRNALAIRAGFEEAPAGVFLFDPSEPGSPDPYMIAEAGNFYVPTWHPSGESLVFGVPGSRREDDLIIASPEGQQLKRLGSYPGRAGFRWDPAGRHLGLAVASEGHGPFEYLEVVDLVTNSRIEVWHEPFIAFEWLPDGAILLCQADEEQGLLRWVRVHPDHVDSPLLLGEPWAPARETIISLHFFEQVKRSHPFLSSDGRHVLYSGWLADELEEHGDGFAVSGAPRVLLTALDGAGSTLKVARGRFGVFGSR